MTIAGNTVASAGALGSPADRVFPWQMFGSGVYDGSWTPEATALMRRHAAILAGKPLWLFTVGSFGEEHLSHSAVADLPDHAPGPQALGKHGLGRRVLTRPEDLPQSPESHGQCHTGVHFDGPARQDARRATIDQHRDRDLPGAGRIDPTPSASGWRPRQPGSPCWIGAACSLAKQCW